MTIIIKPDLGGMSMVKRLLIIGIVLSCMAVLDISSYAQEPPKVELHGFLLARTMVTNSNYTERIDRFGLQLKENMNEEFNWLTEIYVHPTETTNPAARLYMESAYLNWNLKNRVPWDLTVRIGKGRNFTYGITPSYSSRRTTEYSLYSEAFTQVRVLGFQTFSNFGPVQVAVALINPYTCATAAAKNSRPVPDFPIAINDTTTYLRIPITDRDNDNNQIQRVAISGRLGYKVKGLNVGADLYMSELGPAKLFTDKENKQNRYGVDGELKLPCGFLAQVQYTQAKTLSYDHSGGEALVGWESIKFCPKLSVYGRYGMLAYKDDVFQGMNQTMFSAVYKIHPRIHLRLEGLLNGETTGTTNKITGKENNFKKFNNDVILFETMFAW